MSTRKHGRTLRRVLLLTLLLCALAPLPAARAAEEKLIAFTFDDGPSDNTPVLLDGLEARGYVATFFMTASNGGGTHGARAHKDLLRRMTALGCQMANHSYTHASFSRLNADQIKGEIDGVEDFLWDAAGGRYTELVRIPGGVNNETIRATVHRPMIRWSIDPFDWRDRDADVVYERIMNLAHDGGVVLLHDLYMTSIQGGLRAMDSLHEQGYTFVTVSELFRRRGVYLENGVVYENAPSHADAGTKPAYSAPSLNVTVDDKGGTVVSMTCPDIGIDSIHYTTDGTVPSLSSPAYTGPVPVQGSVTIRAAGFDRFATRTPVTVREVSNVTAAPRIAEASRGRMSLTSATPGAAILYTTDGSDPRLSGSVYEGPFTPGQVTKAVAVVPGKARSDVTEITKTSDGSFFYDVSAGAWYYDAVGDMVKRGLMTGVGDYRFDPDSPMTRSALVSVLYRLEGSPSAGTNTPYKDVNTAAWYARPVSWATEHGLINGKTPDSFDPEGYVTRQQAAAILYRYADWSGRTGKAAGSLSGFPDADTADAYAVPALAWCESNGLLRGLADGRLAPKDAAMRAQCASMVSVLCGIPAK